MRLSAFPTFLALILLTPLASAAPPTRTEAVRIAQTFATHEWTASEKNILHGRDADRIEVRTPHQSASGNDPGRWRAGAVNVGVPYKWGGFNSIESFDRGIRAGKAAGDLYNAEKRRLGGAAVSSQAVGIDCSGFISRCWKLDEKQSTSSLASICARLSSAAELRPGDAMNQAGGHVLLFAKWLDGQRSSALFYEAHPFSKVVATERDVTEMEAAGFSPLRYRQMQE